MVVVADVICYWKMTSFMALDGVTSFLRLKDVTDTRKRMRRRVKYWREFVRLKDVTKACKRVRHSLSIYGSSSVQWQKVGRSLRFQICFVVCFVLENPNRSAPVRELLSNNSLFVSKLYEDKSLAQHARDFIFFTTDLQTVNYYSTVHC